MGIFRPPPPGTLSEDFDAQAALEENMVKQALEDGSLFGAPKGQLTGSKFNPSDSRYWAELSEDNMGQFGDYDAFIAEQDIKFASLQAAHPAKPKDLSDLVLDKIEDRLGVETERLNEFAMVVSGMESDYGRNTNNPTSTAKGPYQILDKTFPTAKKRLKKILGYLPENIKNAAQVDHLPENDQKALFFAHLAEDKGREHDSPPGAAGHGSDAKMIDYLEGRTSGAELYKFHHYKGIPTDRTKDRMNKFFKRVR